jgi:hypothetical protein
MGALATTIGLGAMFLFDQVSGAWVSRPPDGRVPADGRVLNRSRVAGSACHALVALSGELSMR